MEKEMDKEKKEYNYKNELMYERRFKYIKYMEMEKIVN